jgi:hypothetical protein
MPFLDTLTSGYLLKIPQDFYLRHNVDNKDQEGRRIQRFFSNIWIISIYDTVLHAKSINLNSGI